MRYKLLEFATRYDRTEHELFEILKLFPNAWIAGGAVRTFCQDLPIMSDIDVFFCNELEFNTFVAAYGGKEPTKSKFHTSFTVGKYQVQAICIRYFESLEDVIGSFDYTICQFATDGVDLIVGPYALWDLARKKLVVHKVTYGAASVRRMLKYAKQGFTACQGTITTLLSEIAADPSLIRSDVVYVD